MKKRPTDWGKMMNRILLKRLRQQHSRFFLSMKLPVKGFIGWSFCIGCGFGVPLRPGQDLSARRRDLNLIYRTKTFYSKA
jgi:hypothetical protein